MKDDDGWPELDERLLLYKKNGGLLNLLTPLLSK